MNRITAFLFALILCSTLFFTAPAGSQTLSQWLVIVRNFTSKPTVCENTFQKAAIIRSETLPSRMIRLKNRKPNSNPETFSSPEQTLTIKQQDTAQFILSPGGEIIGVFKESSSTPSSHEVAAYELCTAIGGRVVPKTEYAIFNTKMGSIREFVEGVTSSQLFKSPSDFKTYMKLLKDTDSTMRQDFDEMVIFDLITGNNDRNLGNYIININTGRLYAIDHSKSFANNHKLVIHWFLDAKESQIWQDPLSHRMRQLIMGIDFSKIKYILRKHRFSFRQKRHIRQRIEKLQSLVKENQDITLEDIVEGMGGFIQRRKREERARASINLQSSSSQPIQ